MKMINSLSALNDLNEFLLPLGYYVTTIDKGTYMIHDSTDKESLRRLFNTEDILWYLVDHRKDHKE